MSLIEEEIRASTANSRSRHQGPKVRCVGVGLGEPSRDPPVGVACLVEQLSRPLCDKSAEFGTDVNYCDTKFFLDIESSYILPLYPPYQISIWPPCHYFYGNIFTSNLSHLQT